MKTMPASLNTMTRLIAALLLCLWLSHVECGDATSTKDGADTEARSRMRAILMAKGAPSTEFTSKSLRVESGSRDSTPAEQYVYPGTYLLTHLVDDGLEISVSD
jgi:hypothetical protein